jgi:microsomal dipeptidase-like Zn-dependent dipeptidase
MLLALPGGAWPAPAVSLSPNFVVDLHAHFPMQFDPENHNYRRSLRSRRQRRRRVPRPEKLGDRFSFWLLELADRFFNRADPLADHAVTLDTLHRGEVGVALSTAYLPFEELDVEEPHDGPPRDHYFKPLCDLLDRVEAEVGASANARMAHDYGELEQALAAGQTAMIHSVEGGFHLGGSEQAIRKHVHKLTQLGVAYVTVAHLFWRHVATNCAALPFMPDSWYHGLFHQPAQGLDHRGRTLIREMARCGILIDLTHMSEASMRDTFAMLDEVDSGNEIPVIASHVGCSFGKYEYNLKQEWVERIAARHGVCGIIYCDHFVRDGRGCHTKTIERSFALVDEQVEKLRAWGGDDVLAIGTDHDGFIKPTLAGLASAADHPKLMTHLTERFGTELTAKIAHENALRVLKQGWRKPFAWPP